MSEFVMSLSYCGFVVQLRHPWLLENDNYHIFAATYAFNIGGLPQNAFTEEVRIMSHINHFNTFIIPK